MTYELFIGDYTYSSWSLRAWLLFDRFGINVKSHMIPFDKAKVSDQMADIIPARTVPTMRTNDGTVVSDSLAIAEELASRHPDAGIWPSDPAARATARSLAAEMHSGFTALRADCPMNLRCAYSNYQPSEDVIANLRRIEHIWEHAQGHYGGDGPWLCGTYSAADAFFAPAAARIAGYGLPVSDTAQSYVSAHLADPSFRRWRAMGLVAGADLKRYAKDHARTDWPGLAPLSATATVHGPSENEACPYSGKPVSHFMELDGRTFGFCNAFCRNKTVADPAAWPAFMKIFGPL